MPFKTVTASQSDVIAVLKQHRAAYPSTGLYPFIIGDDDHLDRLRENESYTTSDPVELIRQADSIDPEVWFRTAPGLADFDDEVMESLSGDWPGEMPVDDGYFAEEELQMLMAPRMHIGLIEIAQPWHLPAALHFGDYNDCPESSVHVAMHRRWQQQYGSQIIAVTSDILICIVERPPATQDAAMALADEQFRYCTDIVTQGCDTIACLGATLLNRPSWYFWWD